MGFLAHGLACERPPSLSGRLLLDPITTLSWFQLTCSPVERSKQVLPERSSTFLVLYCRFDAPGVKLAKLKRKYAEIKLISLNVALNSAQRRQSGNSAGRAVARATKVAQHARICGTKSAVSCFAAMDRQDEIIPEHPNNSNIRCSPQDKRCIQKTLARHPSKSTNQRSNSGREETKAVLVRDNPPSPPPTHHIPGKRTELGNPPPPRRWFTFSFVVLKPHVQHPGLEMVKEMRILQAVNFNRGLAK